MTADRERIYDLDTSEPLFRKLSKLAKKDPDQLRQVKKKILQIQANPKLGKPLRRPMQNVRRVHIGSFVLTYEIDEQRRIVALLDYEHHDKAY